MANDSSGGINVYMTLMPKPPNHHGGSIVLYRVRLVGLCAAVGVACLAGAACGPGKPASPAATPSATAFPSSPSATPAPGAGAATALDAYRSMWKAYAEAIRIPDPAYPDLARYAQGDALAVFVNGLTSVQKNGLVGQGDVTINPSVKGANPNASPPTVAIEDCVDTSKSHLVKKDGSAYQDTPGGHTKATATVSRLADGSWRVSSFALFTAGTC